MEVILAEWHRLLVGLVLLALSALFAGSETAFFSLSREEIRRMKEERGVLPAIAVRLRSAPRRLLVTLLFGNLLVNIAFFAVTGTIAHRLGGTGAVSAGMAVRIAALALVVFVGEFLPKGVAIHRPVGVARFSAAPVWVFETAIFPIRVVLDRAVGWISRLVGGDTLSQESVTPEELKAFVRLSGAAGWIRTGETEMLEDVIDLGNIRVKEVLVPRVDMVSAELGSSREEVIGVAREGRVSKVVLYEEHRDAVKGYVAVKDLLYRPDVRPAELLREMLVVPETMRLDALLPEFRQTGAALALVMDEYGGTEGIVAPEDILEEVVGEIGDEYDEAELKPVRHLSSEVYLVVGEATLREFEEGTKHALPEGKYDTVAGFVVAAFERIPGPGDRIDVAGFRFTVLSVDGGRIRSLIAAADVDGGEE